MTGKTTAVEQCEFCHRRQAAGFAVMGTGVWRRACKRCADARFGLDDR